MIELSEQNVMCLHELLTAMSGGDPTLRDGGLLSSAVLGIFQTFGGEELYPTLEEKAARLGYSLIANHSFVDGNKRIGLLAMMTFLEANGAPLTVSDEELVRVGLAVAAGMMDQDALLAFIRAARR